MSTLRLPLVMEVLVARAPKVVNHHLMSMDVPGLLKPTFNNNNNSSSSSSSSSNPNIRTSGTHLLVCLTTFRLASNPNWALSHLNSSWDSGVVNKVATLKIV